MSRTARSLALPLVLVALAGFSLARIATGEPPTTTLAVPSSASPIARTAAEPVAAGRRAGAPGASPREPGVGGGDAGLRGALDLDRMALEAGRYVAPVAGDRRAILTLEPALQKAAEKALEQAKAPIGAAIVMSVDGRLLAVAGRTQEATRALEPALTAWTPAASIFKLVTAAALVESGIGKDHRTCYHGGFRGVDADNLVDRPGDACETLGFAVAESQNAIIAKLAARHLTATKIGRAAEAFGFGDAPDFALEADGGKVAVPSERLEFARFCAGFWSSELSPLGGALLANVIASGGMRVTPRIVAEVVEGGVAIPVQPAKPRRVLPARIAREVGQMMLGTTRTGTAAKSFHDRRGRRLLSVDVAGKTGSLVRLEPSFLEYSLFVGYAPVDKPEVVIAVALGNPARWHLKAHTAARLILDGRY